MNRGEDVVLRSVHWLLLIHEDDDGMSCVTARGQRFSDATAGQERVGTVPWPAVVSGAVAVSSCVQSTASEGATHRTAAAAAADRYIITIIIIMAVIEGDPSYIDVICGLINIGTCHSKTTLRFQRIHALYTLTQRSLSVTVELHRNISLLFR